ncbi:hypothetical protein [Streptomyces sp. H39-S7]|uniref:hypothetical protein n=1 Tax=Streptomyces sp. H39-S7 TaxID=3004357 RepID=UPI0022AE6C58|nr:hypothetical protein [Streptomyces sp. H39-S7]MCZ4119699.1 hypothetical protein [Streptomyces sp. H39-S7]
MTITETPGPRRAGPAVLARGFLAAAMAGAAAACVVVGIVIRDVALWCAGGGLFALTLVVMTLAARRKRARTPRREKHRALAMIESRRATSGESADVPIRFVLTVAPDDRAAYRVEFSQPINLVDVPDYRPRGIVVVEYPADEPWATRIITEPDPEWAARAAEARLDSAPESAVVTDPNTWGSCCLIGVAGLLVGAAVVVLLFRAELFDDEGGVRAGGTGASSPSTSSFSLSATTTETSESMLLDGQMRRTAAAMIAAHSPTAVEFTIEEHRMSARGIGPRDASASNPSIDLRTLPYERLPGLVREARATSGIGDTGTWRIAVGHDPGTKAPLIRVTVSDAHRSAFLLADAQGRVTQRAAR